MLWVQMAGKSLLYGLELESGFLPEATARRWRDRSADLTVLDLQTEYVESV